MTITPGRGWAYVGVVLGAAVSVAANVAHSYVPPADAPAGWHPHAGAVVGAVFWPVALLVAIEIMARVPWPAGARWTLLRFGGLVPVAVVAAVVSYRHLSGLLTFYGEDGITAGFGPLAVDGLMVMATGALLATAGIRAETAPEPAAAPPPVPVPEPVVAAEAVPEPAEEWVVPELVTEPVPEPPPAVPRTRPAARNGQPSTRQRMRDYIHGQVAAGRALSDLSGRELDDQFGTRDWGRQVLRAVRAESNGHH